MKQQFQWAVLSCLFLIPTLLFSQFSPIEGTQQLMRKRQQKKDVLDLFDQTGVPSIFTEIDPTKGAELVGPHGTIVRIPPNAFVTKSGKQVTGPVVFEFKEVATKADILLTNVPTVSNGQILESGGVVYLDAKAEDEPLEIAEDKSIEVEFPQEKTKEGMQGFSGKYDQNGQMNWTAMESPLTADANTLIFKDGKHTVQGYLYSMINQYSDCYGTEQFEVLVDFDIPTGRTDKVRIVGYAPCYYEAVPEIMKNVVWKTDASEPGIGQVKFKVDFNNPGSGPNHPWNHKPIPADEAFTYYDPNYEIAADQNATTRLTNRLQVTNLGWVNWDKFDTPPARQDFVVKMKGGMEKGYARVFVVYDFKTIILDAKQVAEDSYKFEQVPVGIPGYVIGVSYLKKQPYLVVEKMDISGKDVKLALKPTSIEEMKAQVGQYLN